MNTFFLSLLLAFSTSATTPVKEVKINKTHLLQHWVHSVKESKNGVITYRPFRMAVEKKVSMDARYSGMEIKKGGKLRQHRWIPCGNDTGPSGYNYRWKLKTREDGATLLIIKKRQTYKILRLTKNILKVQVVKS